MNPARFLTDSVLTASPQRLLLMLWDRLVLDLERGVTGFITGDGTGRDRLAHAQQIVLELRATLDLEIWPEGRALAAVYVWCHTELTGAWVDQDAVRARAVLDLLRPLRDAWRQAAEALVAGGAVPVMSLSASA